MAIRMSLRQPVRTVGSGKGSISAFAGIGVQGLINCRGDNQGAIRVTEDERPYVLLVI